MMTRNYKKAYSEVVGFLNSLAPEEYIKIPRETIEFYEWNMDYNYNFKYNPTKTLEEQKITKEAKTIILKFFLDYFATEKQKLKIKKILDQNQQKVEKEKREKYKSDYLKK